MNNLYYVLGAGVLAMLYAFWKTSWINNQDEGSDRMKQIGASIADGAMAFLKAEYRVLAIFVVIVACLLAFAANNQGDSWLVSVSFLSGAIASALAGYLGMKVATKANNRIIKAISFKHHIVHISKISHLLSFFLARYPSSCLGLTRQLTKMKQLHAALAMRLTRMQRPIRHFVHATLMNAPILLIMINALHCHPPNIYAEK